MKLRILVISSLLLFSCNYIGAGSLGAWKIKGFPITNKQLALSISNLYEKYPQYIVPEKWKYELDYWKDDTFQSSKMLFFYFGNEPEEMYFVTFVEPGLTRNPDYVRVAIAAIYTQNTGWKEIDKYNDEEKIRTEKRFEDEIIMKLEKLTNTKSFYEKTYP